MVNGRGVNEVLPLQIGGLKSFNLEKGGGWSKKFLNLNTMSSVHISIITNSKNSQILMPKRQRRS